jgi:peptide/nickel transport system permease protein
MSDDRSGHEPSVAIDLSRRKDRPGDGRAPADRLASDPLEADLAADRSDAGVVRHSIVEVRWAAAPYVTMARIAITRLARDRAARAGALGLALLALVGVFADVFASDLPIACRWHRVLYVIPNVTHPAALESLDNASMARDRAPGDWSLPPLVSYGPDRPSAEILLAPLTGAHPFAHPLGTDGRGRDVFSRVVHGARTTLGLGLAAAMTLVVVGASLGALAGFAGGIADALVTRAIESLTAIPTLVLVLVVGAIVPHPTTATFFYTIALTRWTELARLMRGEVLVVLATDYVTAARALGASSLRVLFRHVLPNALGPALVAAAFAVAWVVLVQATVDFLRVSSPDTMASWGEMMGEARGKAHAWWLVAFPAAALLATLVALNLIGEAARNALDPRLHGHEHGG